jgi:nucleotide-binding universal stress UspA family protein
LHDVAVAEGAAAIVLGATRHAVHGCMALGSVSERLLSGAPCPLVVAPRGYEMHSAVGVFERIGAAYVPGSEGRRAVRAAGLLAARGTTPVQLMEVADPRVWAADVWAGRADAGALALAQRDVIAGHLEQARESLPPGVAATTTVLNGDPAEELRRASAELDLLVCGSRDYGPVSGVLAGGVAKVLMHGAACPVMVVPRGPVPEAPAAAGSARITAGIA